MIAQWFCFTRTQLNIIFLWPSFYVGGLVVQSGASATAAGVTSAPHSPDFDNCDYVPCQTVPQNESYAKKPLPPVKSAVSRAFKWHRSQSVDNIPHDVVNDSKPKTPPNSKGIHSHTHVHRQGVR